MFTYLPSLYSYPQKSSTKLTVSSVQKQEQNTHKRLQGTVILIRQYRIIK